MAQNLERFVEAVDEATYDPVEWAMDVDQGIRQRVDGTIQSLINNLTRNR